MVTLRLSGAMARKLRVEYEGAIYHVMSRGDRRQEIFLDDDDRERFLGTLGEVCERTGWLREGERQGAGRTYAGAP